MISRYVITILVIIQIIVISVSFGIIFTIETQEKNAIDYVNIAGKNRMYTALTLHELDKFNSGITSERNLDDICNEYNNNILLLKNGGDFLGHKISSLPENYSDELKTVEEKFLEFKSLANDLKKFQKSGQLPTEIYNMQQNRLESELLIATDTLTKKITLNYSQTIKQKADLELILPIINAMVYIVTIFVIFRTLTRESKQIQKLEKLYAIGQMASRLAHDLKNPLSVIKLNLDLLETKSVTNDEFSLTMYGKLKNSLKEIFHIIDDVLEFVRTKELNLSKTSLLKILNESVLNINVPKTVTIELPQNDIELECDQTKLKAVFVNLFNNALYAIENKGIISVKINDTQTSVKISVTDSGSGIPKNILPEIFEPLFTSKPTGTGLGLGICKNIIEQHNGKITVTNNPTTFTVELPKTQ